MMVRCGFDDFRRVWGIRIFGWPVVQVYLPSNERPPFRWTYVSRRSPWWEWPWVETEGAFLYVFSFCWRLKGVPREAAKRYSEAGG